MALELFIVFLNISMFLFFNNPNFKNLYFVFPIFILWLFICYKKRKNIIEFLKEFLEYVLSSFKFSWASLIILILLSSYALYLPLTYDESFTFIQFVDRNIFYATCTYPAPNNHVLHSILSNITWHIFQWTELALFVRLPAIIASFLLISLFVVKVAKQNTFFTTLFIAVMLLNLPFLSFSFQARGYSMQTLFAAFSILQIFTKSTEQTFKFRNNSILLFSLLGLFTSLAYLYVFVSLYTTFLTHNLTIIKKNIPYLISTTAIFVLTIVLLYSPIVVFRGYESIVHNKFVRPLDNFDFLYLLNHYIESLIEVSGGNIIAAIIFSLLFYFSIKNKHFGIIPFLLAPLCLMLILNQTPFSRVFLPFSIAVLLVVFLDLKQQSWPQIKYRNLISSIIISVSIIISTVRFFKIPNGGMGSSFNVKYLSKYFDKHIYLHNNTHDHLKIALIANFSISDTSFELIDSTSEVKKESIIIFSQDLDKPIKVVDSLLSGDKKVFIGYLK